jgi:hypothetical protein
LQQNLHSERTGKTADEARGNEEGIGMADLKKLATLVCGGDEVDVAQSDCEVSKILLHLRNILVSVLEELDALGAQSPERISLYGPFLTRSLLEVAVTALIGRLDPMRVLVVKRVQEHGNYDTTKPWNAAIRWQGDVLDKKVGDLWTPERSYKEMTKALFGDYYVELYWKTALAKIQDPVLVGGSWLAAIRSKSIEEFANSRRELVSKLYSESSKGIHAEFVVPPGSKYDKMTVANMAARVIEVLSELGLLLNLLPHIAYTLPKADASAIFAELENVEVLQ